MNTSWIAIASAEHARRGRERGFMQVCHGRSGPLRRIRPGDGIVYYSPTTAFGEKDGLRAFTAIAAARDGDPYCFDMGGGFRPFRRDVDWAEARETAITPLLGRLDLTAGKPNWGYQLRFGLVEIGADDFCRIAEAMGTRSLALRVLVPGC